MGKGRNDSEGGGGGDLGCHGDRKEIEDVNCEGVYYYYLPELIHRDRPWRSSQRERKRMGSR